MDNYVLIKSYNKANVQNRLWYSMTKNDLDGLLSDGKISFGDRGYVIQTKKFYVCGNDNSWYEAAESGGGGEAELIEKVISENGVYNASDEGADGYSKVTVDVPGEYYGYPIRSKSGSIATIPDGADNVPISDGVFDIDYDANGYSAMRIGKSAVNLCGGAFLLENAQEYLYGVHTDLENKTFTFAASASTTTGSKGFSGSLYRRFKPNTKYTAIFRVAKSSTTSSSTNFVFYYTDGTYSAFPNLPSGFEANTKYTIIAESSGTKTLSSIGKRNVSGSTTVWYEECGFFEGTLSEQDFEAFEGESFDLYLGFGKNLFAPVLARSGYTLSAQGYMSANENYNIYKLVAQKGKRYTFSFEDSETETSKNARILFRNQDTETIVDVVSHSYTDASGRTSFSFTAPTADFDLCYISLRTTSSNWQLEEGSTATTYEPYEYIYGGYFDSVTGMLVSTKAADGTDLEVPDVYELKPVEIRTDEETNIWCDTGDSTIWYRSETFMKEVLKDGVIASTTSQYVTATFDDVSEYDELNITLTLNGVAQYASTTYKVADIGNGVTLTTRMMPTDKSIEFYLTKTSIAASYYTGSWLNITASIVATKSGAISLASKTITANGTYIASAENHDGYSSVVVNVSGGGQTLTLHEGKISMSDGSIVADSDYYYSDFFDAPNGKVIFDIGEIDNDYGLPWYHSDGTYVDHFSASERSRQVNMAVYYQTGDKFRFTFKKSILADAFLIDLVNTKAYCVSAIKLAEE